MATKTDLFLKYIEEMYLKGTFEKDEQVMGARTLDLNLELGTHSVFKVPKQ